MKPLLTRVVVTSLALCLAGCGSQPSLAQTPPLLKAIASVRLPDVNGRIDHLAHEPRTGRLFVAALENDTVEVVDTATNRHVRSLSGFHEPQGIAALSDLGAVAIANGASGTLQLVDVETLQTRWTIPIGSDADNVRTDPAAKRLYVAAQGGLFVVDPAAGKVVQRISIEGHPESFQLESSGLRMFANLPGRSQVVVVDRRSASVAGRWLLTGCAANYPMALEDSLARLFVGCRRPATLAVLDTKSGQPVAMSDIVGDTDDLFYDSSRQRVYVIGGEGSIDVLSYRADRIQHVSRVDTRAGARTGLWVAAQNRLFVAVPARGGQPAEIRVFAAVD